MHSHHADMFDGIEFGVRFEVRAVKLTPAQIKASHAAEDARLKARADAEKSKATPKQKVDSAASDGKLTTGEKKVITNSGGAEDARKAAKENQAQIKKRLEDSKKGRNVQIGTGASAKVDDRANLRKRLAEDKAQGGDIESLEKRAKELDGKNPEGAAAIKEQIQRRKDDEKTVVNEIKDKTALRGNLEIEEAVIKADTETDESVTQRYEAKARDALSRFNTAAGKTDNSQDGRDGWRDDDWKTPAGKTASFRELADRFKKHPNRLNEFVAGQGRGDVDLVGKSDKEVAEYAKRFGGAEATNIIARHQAAKELEPIIREYNEQRTQRETGKARLDQITQEKTKIDAEIAEDRKLLSRPTEEQMDKEMKQVVDYTDDGTSNDPSKDKGETPPAGEKPADNGNSNEKPGTENQKPADKHKNENEKPGTNTNTTKIDYSTPEARAKVMKAAQKHGLLPKDNVTFNKQGEAQYTVQRGDSFWRVADQTDGNRRGLDAGYFQKTVNTNMKRLGRSNANYLEIGDRLVLPNRSVNDLIRLLKLPTARPESSSNDSNNNRNTGNGGGGGKRMSME